MKDNKLIAEFMGYTHQSDSAFKDENGFWNDFEVFETWNWLMPVLKKIDSYACEEMDFSDYDDYRNKYVFIHNISLHNDIREVYNQIVEFINEHNNN